MRLCPIHVQYGSEEGVCVVTCAPPAPTPGDEDTSDVDSSPVGGDQSGDRECCYGGH